ncbi:MAG: F0F1 ATP synthase subunit A [Patescibacteria group bacterium]|jgi:F-type H+-transporting ATPase subunit a
MKISLVAEELFHIGGFPITNTLIVSWIVMAVLVIVSILATRNMKLVPTGLQNLMETVIEMLFKLFNTITQSEKLTRKFFPLVATIFLFVIMSNWTEALPGLDSIGLKPQHEVTAEKTVSSGLPSLIAIVKASKNEGPESINAYENAEKADTLNIESKPGEEDAEGATESKAEEHIIPFLRSPSSDLNFTLALAIIAVVSIQVFGVVLVGFRNYSKKFFNFSGPIQFAVGLLELVSEFSKLLSFSLRLFGNIFAGEVLLIVISFLVPYLVPIPFMGMELFVGFIQALIFSMLTLVFLTMAATAEEH